MLIFLRRVNNDQHSLEVLRADGTRSRMLCETRSYLAHDFLHYAVESLAKTEEGFWGGLAAGKEWEELKNMAEEAFQDPDSRIATIERVVGWLHALSQGADVPTVMALLAHIQATSGLHFPPWLNEEFVRAAQALFRRLKGQWEGTAFTDTMQLEWPDPSQVQITDKG